MGTVNDAEVATQTRLSESQVRRLRAAQARYEADETATRERFRAALQGLVDEGASYAAIARELGVSRQAVHDRLTR